MCAGKVGGEGMWRETLGGCVVLFGLVRWMLGDGKGEGLTRRVGLARCAST